MRRIDMVGPMIVTALLSIGSAVAQRSAPLADNAALRYWAAFSELQDAAISDQDAKALNAALDTMGPLDFAKYKDLLQKNTPALELMARGTSLSNCDWGLDYGLGEDVPVEYARKALTLGRLNVLYAIQQYHAGNKDGAVRALAAGLRFSHDVANGGSLFATIIAKDLLMTHLQAASDAMKLGTLSNPPRVQIQEAIKRLGAHGVDWQAGMRQEMQVLNRPPWQKSVSLADVTEAYLAALADPSQLGRLQQMLNTIPQPLRDVIPNPQEVVQQKQELDGELLQLRPLMQQ